MPSWLDKIFSNANSVAQDQTVQINADQVRAFREELNRNKTIRLYVGTGANYGNQTATVNLLRRLVGPVDATNNLTFNYGGIIDVFYEGGDETLNKLFERLPELNGKETGTIRNATVNLHAYDADKPPQDKLIFGFTGAVDSNNNNYARTLNVAYFLQLQPYNYNYAEKIWFMDGNRDPIDLTLVEALNNPSFKRRLFYMPATTYNNPDWTYYTDIKAQILQYLTGDNILNNVRLVVSYANNIKQDWAATILCGSLLQWQDGGNYRLAAPVIVLNLSSSNPQQVANLLAGGYTTNEKIILMHLENVKARQKYMQTLKSAERFSYVNSPATLDPVQNAVENIINHKDSVLFIQLNQVEQPLFFYLLYKTNMFSLFEGANSTMAAVNIGKPFLALPRIGSGVQPALYPNVNRGFFSSSPPINQLATAANQLNINLESWPFRTSSNPCNQLGIFLQTLTDQIGADDPIPRYFSEVKDTYATSADDKLNVALAYLMNIYQQDNPAEQLIATTALASNGGSSNNPLNVLYQTLKEHVVIGQKLDLIPGVIAGGNINEVILALLKDYDASLWMIVEKFDHESEEDNITKITLNGTTGVFQSLQITNAITVIFDAPDNQLRCGVMFSSDGTWSISGVPWIQMSDPFLQIMVCDGQLPVTAKIGGTYEPLGANLSILIPVTDNQWLTTVGFDSPYPSIDKAFQMAASINLVERLPPPFNVLSDLGLERMDLYYDSQKQDVPSLGFIIKNNSSTPLPLVGNISLNDIEVLVALIEPKTSRQIQAAANGTFMIGQGTNAGVVTVNVQYPNLLFKGSLTSGVIKISDLLELFLPGVELNPPAEPTITEFDFSYDKQNDLLSVSMAFNIPWTFNFLNKDLFTIDDVRFAISRISGQNTGNVIGSVVILPDSADLVLTIGAYYQGSGNWTFSATQTSGVLDLGELLNYYLGTDWAPSSISFPTIDGLSITLDWVNKTAAGWKFTGKTAEPWSVPFIPDLNVSASLTAGYNGQQGNVAALPAVAGSSMALALADAGNAMISGPFARIETDWTWENIEINIWFDYNPQVNSFGITWEELEGNVTGPDPKTQDYVATLSFKKDTTLGSIVETMVSWVAGSKFGLEAPWNFLDSIPLSNLALNYTFNKQDKSRNKVTFAVNIGPIDLGFARIDSIDIGYESVGLNKGVMVTLSGSFPWNIGDEAMGDTGKLGPWDTSQPGTAPAPPGNGNQYLDLRLLALGQHVTYPGFTSVQTVQEAIALMRDLPDPEPGKIPPIQFDPSSSWLVGADFGILKLGKSENGAGGGENQALVPYDTALVSQAEGENSGYFLTLQIVFNDPHLYALRIALAGETAKIFKGLDFQIMYRQISDTVGVYQAEITLPDVMRHLSIGAYSITLPVFAIAIYTNGDFSIDIGFPWNENFSRSFTIEGIIAPGIPVLGSAGLYFSKLSSATTNKVPQASNGTFNPVIVFGFGLQVGFGKSIEYGILKAGFSLTVTGIIEGVIATWNPYQLTDGSRDNTQLQDA